MLIKVTEEHIRKGNRDNCCSCAVALAICEAVNTEADGRMITVYRTGYRLYDGKKILFNNDKVTEFIDRFDSQEPVDPFEFELEYEPCDS